MCDQLFQIPHIPSRCHVYPQFTRHLDHVTGHHYRFTNIDLQRSALERIPGQLARSPFRFYHRTRLIALTHFLI